MGDIYRWKAELETASQFISVIFQGIATDLSNREILLSYNGIHVPIENKEILKQ